MPPPTKARSTRGVSTGTDPPPQRSRGPQLRIADDDESDDDDEYDGPDEDVERLAAQAVDRKRQTAIDVAVAAAEATVRKELTESHSAAMDAARKDFSEEYEALHKEHAARREISDSALIEEKAKNEALEAELAALKAKFSEVEAERDELETGILRARDICAAKDAEAREAAGRAQGVAAEAVAAAQRLAETERSAAIDDARRDAEARLATQYSADLQLAVESSAREAEARMLASHQVCASPRSPPYLPHISRISPISLHHLLLR